MNELVVNLLLVINKLIEQRDALLSRTMEYKQFKRNLNQDKVDEMNDELDKVLEDLK